MERACSGGDVDVLVHERQTHGVLHCEGKLCSIS